MRAIDADKLCEDLLTRWSIADEKQEQAVREIMANVVTPIVVSQPTITADRPRGEWLPCSFSGLLMTEQVRKEGIKWYGYRCSNCDHIRKGNALIECNYCPYCGADMRGEQR